MWTNIKETSKSALLVFYEGNSTVTDEFPAQRASNAKKNIHDVIMVLFWFGTDRLTHIIQDYKLTIISVPIEWGRRGKWITGIEEDGISVA